MTSREKAKREYLAGKSLKDIASEIGVKDSTVRGWKYRDGWPKVQRKRKTKNKNVADEKNVAKQSAVIADPLNDKQQLFAELYVRSFNAVQSYMTVYGCEYNTAASQGYKLLKNTAVRAYVQSLKEIKKQAIMADETDVVEMYMKIAFSSIGDFVKFGRKDVQVMTAFGPLTDKDTNEPVMKTVNYVDMKESSAVDPGVIAEISQGKDGVRIKLADRMKALEWLGKFFNVFPMDQHRIEYDRKKQELDRLEYDRKKKHDESEDF